MDDESAAGSDGIVAGLVVVMAEVVSEIVGVTDVLDSCVVVDADAVGESESFLVMLK